MNFTFYNHLEIFGHRDIDFVDIHIDTDNRLYIDPERIALSSHPFAIQANDILNDFFSVLCQAAAQRNRKLLYHLVSFGKEPNETHLGLSSSRSCGKGTTPEILMPIVNDMIDLGLFDSGLITQIGDLHLWTPNFHYDRLSDLTTNIIRSVLVEYTYEQYETLGLPLPQEHWRTAPVWDLCRHEWVLKEFPHFLSGKFPTLLVPKDFVGRQMLSSPGELLHKYALRYRQQEHLDERSDYCHLKIKRNGDSVLMPPTKRELYNLEVKGQPAKEYLIGMGNSHPQIVNELHNGHRAPNYRGSIFISDNELDSILYRREEIAI